MPAATHGSRYPPRKVLERLALKTSQELVACAARRQRTDTGEAIPADPEQGAVEWPTPAVAVNV